MCQLTDGWKLLMMTVAYLRGDELLTTFAPISLQQLQKLCRAAAKNWLLLATLVAELGRWC